MSARNVELKATDPCRARSLEVCRELGAADHGELRQRDTYFDVPEGALKLREETPGRPHLIQYRRAREAQERESRYRIVGTDDAPGLRAALGDSLGVLGIVTKRRRLFLWRAVRIHLDHVEGLGDFLELEAVAPVDSDLAAEHALVRELRAAFGIDDDRLLADGYLARVQEAALSEWHHRL